MNGMTIRISKAGKMKFDAEVSPPEAKELWRTQVPMPLRELIAELKRRGCHQTDITDVLYELEPDWVSKLE